jgi:hypothetical protein
MSSLSHRRKKAGNSGLLLFAFLLAFNAIACQRSQEGRRPQHAPSKAIVRFVDVDSEAPISVSCDGLESYWGSDVDTLVIEDRPFLDSLASVISSLTPAKKGFTPDARMVVDVYFADGSKRVLCLSNIAVALDKQEMEFEPILLSLMQSRTRPQQH